MCRALHSMHFLEERLCAQNLASADELSGKSTKNGTTYGTNSTSNIVSWEELSQLSLGRLPFKLTRQWLRRRVHRSRNSTTMKSVVTPYCWSVRRYHPSPSYLIAKTLTETKNRSNSHLRISSELCADQTEECRSCCQRRSCLQSRCSDDWECGFR